MTPKRRIQNAAFASKVMSADAAAALISNGSSIGMSGFTGSGYPKAVPEALARRIGEANKHDDRFSVSVWTGASTGPDLDGALAAVDGIDLRMPYQGDPVTRAKINAGLMDYLDIHLSHVAQMVWEGFFGHLDLAIVEVSGITPEGQLIPSSSIGNNKTWLDLADRVILEVNSWQTGSGYPTCNAILTRSSLSSSPTRPTATPSSRRLTLSRARSQATSSSSWSTR
jgi:succinyl-CoA:acetate CoA-transferase